MAIRARAGVARELICPQIERVQPAAFGADPEDAIRILYNGSHGVTAEAGRVDWIVAVVKKGVSDRSIPIQPTAVRANPKGPCAVEIEGTHAIGGQTIGIGRDMPIMRHPVLRSVEPIETSAIGADPQVARKILGKGAHLVIAETIGVVGVVAIDLEAVGQAVELADACAVGADPEYAGAVFQESEQRIGAQTGWVAWIAARDDKAFAIKAVQPVRRADPDRPPAILIDEANAIAAQACWFGRVVPVLAPCARGGVAPVQARAVGAHPQAAVAILEDRRDHFSAQAV